MKFNQLFLFLVLCYLSCQNNQTELNGHWHVSSTKNFKNFPDEFHHLYIQDTIRKLWYNSFYTEIPFRIDKDNEKFAIQMECLNGLSGFEIIGNTLIKK